jgi:hypothetical protein
MKRKVVILAILGILFLFIRLSIMFSSVDEICPFDCLLQSGILAKHLIENRLIMSLFDYQSEEWEGNSVFYGLLAVPFFLLFGQTYISLKLMALIFSLGILILLYLFLDKFFNERTAVLASLLLIFSPPIYTKESLAAAGGHYATNLFTFLILLIFYSMLIKQAQLNIYLSKSEEKRQDLYFILLGLASGFGLWFSYAFLLTLFVCLLFWFVFDRIFFVRRSFLLFLGSSLVGFGPGIYYNITHSFEGVNIFGRPIYTHFLSNTLFQSLTKFKDLLTFDIVDSFLFGDLFFIKGEFISYFYYLIFLLSFCVVFWSNRKSILKLVSGFIPLRQFKITPKGISRETLLLIYPLVFFLIYSISDFKLGRMDEDYFIYKYDSYRYLALIFPFICIIMALFLNKMWEKKRKFFRLSCVLIGVILLLTGCISSLNIILFHNFGKWSGQKGYSYVQLGRVIGWRFGHNLDRCIRLIEKKIDKKDRSETYVGLVFGIGRDLEFGDTANVDRFLDACIDLIERLDGEYKQNCCIALAEKIVYDICSYDIGRSEYIKLCNKAIRKIGKENRDFFYRTLKSMIREDGEKELSECIGLIPEFSY